MTARTPLISGNWKMHHNHFEAIQTVQKLAYLLPKEATDEVDVSVHPPFTDLRSVQTLIAVDDLPLALGAQNCHHEDNGAFTGEVSPAFLAKLDVRYVIVGHSERRQMFGDTDEVVLVESNPQAVEIIRHNMKVVGHPHVTVEQAKVSDYVPRAPKEHFSMVLADPPYAVPVPQVLGVLQALADGGWLAPEAVLVVERPSREEPWDWPTPLTGVRDRRYGEAVLRYGRAP